MPTTLSFDDLLQGSAVLMSVATALIVVGFAIHWHLYVKRKNLH